jgi:SAM-dependent methyltransferase
MVRPPPGTRLPRASGLPRMNVRSVIDEIHARVERQSNTSPSIGVKPAASSNDLAILRSAYERMYRTRDLVGQMPPSPDTFRARVSKHLLRLIQRALFWYTPQIRRFQDETTLAMGAVCGLVESQMTLIASLQLEIKSLRAAMIAARPIDIRMTETTTTGPDSSNTLGSEFEFALQDHFRGSEEETRAKLAHWLPRIRQILGGMEKEKGPWLDIGCGRGEWLALARESGHTVCGVDSSPLSIDRCREQGLEAEQAECLDYLSRQVDGSLSVITAFHVVEHMPIDRVLALLQLSHRKLRAGGMLVLETPNPANLPMGAHHFWNDPTHRRPLPADFLEFSLRYFGFTVSGRVDLNPAPVTDHLPFAEIELVRRVNEHLYGPQDYGFIGQRNA